MREERGTMACAQQTAFTIARAEPRAKSELWLFPVFVLFRPVIDGRSGRTERRRLRGFPVCIPSLTGKRAAAGCSRRPVFLLLFAACFSPVIYREIQEARGSPSQVADA